MSKELINGEKGRLKPSKSEDDKSLNKQPPGGPTTGAAAILNLQRQVGNQAVQRLVTQRQSEDGFDLDDNTTNRINQARGGGKSLDGAVQTQMGEAMGFDFSGVKVHTSSEADSLNQDLGAKAFTTGQDIFFKEGTYNPGSSDGQELLAHEMAHVVQQSTGRVDGGGSGMTVRPAGDAFEQEADAVASQVVNSGSEAAVQTKMEGAVQREEAPLEEEVPPEGMQMKRDETIQREEAPLEEEEVPPEGMQMKRDEAVQREAAIPEEEVDLKRDEAVQRVALEDEEIV